MLVGWTPRKVAEAGFHVVQQCYDDVRRHRFSDRCDAKIEGRGSPIRW